MSNLTNFAEYAAAFEETYADDNWARLEQYFAPNAVYVLGEGTRAVGRDAVLKTLKNSVNNLDRRFANRTLVALAPPVEDGDLITFPWRATYEQSDGASLVIDGVEYVTYYDSVIQRLEDALDAESMAAIKKWIEGSAN